MALIPLTPLDHMGAIPAYKAGIDAMASDSEASLDDISQDYQVQNGSKGKISRQHQLPPLATHSAGASGREKDRRSLGSRGSGEGDGEPEDVDDPHHVGIQCPFPFEFGRLVSQTVCSDVRSGGESFATDGGFPTRTARPRPSS